MFWIYRARFFRGNYESDKGVSLFYLRLYQTSFSLVFDELLGSEFYEECFSLVILSRLENDIKLELIERLATATSGIFNFRDKLHDVNKLDVNLSKKIERVLFNIDADMYISKHMFDDAIKSLNLAENHQKSYIVRFELI